MHTWWCGAPFYLDEDLEDPSMAAKKKAARKKAAAKAPATTPEERREANRRAAEHARELWREAQALRQAVKLVRNRCAPPHSRVAAAERLVSHVDAGGELPVELREHTEAVLASARELLEDAPRGK